MLFPSANSRYGSAFFSVLCAVFTGIFFVTWIAALCVQRKRQVSQRLRIVVAVLYIVGSLSMILCWSFLQSSQMINFFVAMVLAILLPIFPTSVLLAYLLSEKWTGLLFARPKAKRAVDGEFDHLSEHSHGSGPATPAGSTGSNGPSEPTSTDSGAEYDSRPPAAVYVAALKEQRIKFAGAFIVLFVIMAFTTSMTYGGCFCVKPNSYTTWATRKPFCSPNEMCHAYFQPGQNCTQIDAVAHYVGPKPSSWSVNVCQGSQVSCSRTTPGVNVMVKLHTPVQVPQDERYMLHVRAFGLYGDSVYTFTFQVSGKTVTKTVRTFSCSPAAPMSYIAGGDFFVGDIGSHLLQQGHDALGGEERFIYVGGDLSYSNNMRFCFARADEFVDRMTRVKRADGTSLPLLVAIGNHEGGGYLKFKNRQEREEGLYFQNDYFPAFGEGNDFYQSADPTSTFHSHVIGPTGWIVLDSEIVFPLADQAAWLNLTLTKWVEQIKAGTLRDIMVTYHNPAWPSVRSFDNDQAVAVRTHVVPVIDSVWPHVPLVFEHHDHAYKRTHPLLDGKAILQEMTLKPKGVVYVGDGSWGVSRAFFSVKSTWYTEKSFATNYVLAVRHLDSTTDPEGRKAHVLTLDENGNHKDEFYV